MISTLVVPVLSLLSLGQEGVPAPKADGLDLPAKLKELDELYTRRDAPEAIKESDAALKTLLAAAPDDVGVNWRAARWHFWLSELATTRAAKERLSKSGWDLAERAVAKDPSSVDAHYWGAATCGTYGDQIGILKALTNGIEARFRKHLDFVVEKQPGYDNAGPLLTLGRYYYKLPWPKHDAKKSIENLKAALKLSPKCARARVYLAEVLFDEDTDNAKEALRLLDEVGAQAPGTYDAPEERLQQKAAKELKLKIEEKLK